jgi:hypothetical protein
MSNHLSEEQIQLYLDKQDRQNIESLEAHLKTCPSCMKSIEEYKHLYEALNMDPFPSLSNDFSEQVVSKISGSENSRSQFFESGFTIAFFLFGIAASLYFVNPLPFITNIANNIFGYLGGVTLKFLPELNGNFPIFLVAILIFLLVEVIDKKLLRSRL